MVILTLTLRRGLFQKRENTKTKEEPDTRLYPFDIEETQNNTPILGWQLER